MILFGDACCCVQVGGYCSVRKERGVADEWVVGGGCRRDGEKSQRIKIYHLLPNILVASSGREQRSGWGEDAGERGTSRRERWT